MTLVPLLSGLFQDNYRQLTKLILVDEADNFMAERGDVIHLYVFPQNNRNGRFFKPKGKKIF